jgi:hypothetical protein
MLVNFQIVMSFATHETTSVCGRIAVHDSAPYINVLAGSTISIGSTSITKLSASIHIIPVEESKTHVLSFDKLR